MEAIKRIVGTVDRTYLVRAYIIGGIFFVLWFLFIKAGAQDPIGFVIYILLGLITTALFPFAKLTWDELWRFAFGNTMFILPIIFLYPAKIVINALLWIFAFLIAPLGILYLAFRTRQQ